MYLEKFLSGDYYLFIDKDPQEQLVKIRDLLESLELPCDWFSGAKINEFCPSAETWFLHYAGRSFFWRHSLSTHNYCTIDDITSEMHPITIEEEDILTILGEEYENYRMDRL